MAPDVERSAVCDFVPLRARALAHGWTDERARVTWEGKRVRPDHAASAMERGTVE